MNRPSWRVLAAAAVLLAPAWQASATPDQRALQEGVTRVVIDGALQVDIEPADAVSVRIADDKGCARSVVWTVREGTLSVSNPPGRCDFAPQVRIAISALSELTVRGPADVTVSELRTPRLKVSAEGSGDIELEELDCDELELVAAGTGDVTANGSARHQRYELAGEGDIDAARLVGTDIEVVSSGSGDIHVQATRTLRVVATGSGDVRYSGRPAVRQSGSARVVRAD